jgi:cytochrome c oxidase assembly factor CtaG
MPSVTPSRYFIAAAIVLLLGAAAVPVAIAAYRFAETSRESYATAVGVWGTIVMIVSIAGPVVLTVAGIVAMWTRKAEAGTDQADPFIDEATAWLSDERQITGRR